MSFWIGLKYMYVVTCTNLKCDLRLKKGSSLYLETENHNKIGTNIHCTSLTIIIVKRVGIKHGSRITDQK